MLFFLADKTLYKALTFALLTLAILTLVFIQYFKGYQKGRIKLKCVSDVLDLEKANPDIPFKEKPDISRPESSGSRNHPLAETGSGESFTAPLIRGKGQSKMEPYSDKPYNKVRRASAKEDNILQKKKHRSGLLKKISWSDIHFPPVSTTYQMEDVEVCSVLQKF